jgi:hypothetical protein
VHAVEAGVVILSVNLGFINISIVLAPVNPCLFSELSDPELVTLYLFMFLKFLRFFATNSFLSVLVLSETRSLILRFLPSFSIMIFFKSASHSSVSSF